MFLLLACAALASAAVKPYALADLGMSIPSLEGGAYDDENFAELAEMFDVDLSGKGEGGLCWSIGGGVLIPMSEQLAFDGWAVYASVPYNAKHTFEFAGSETTDFGTTPIVYTMEGKGTLDIDVTTSLVEFGGGVRWSATPTLGLGCGFQYSHVLSSEYEGTYWFSYSVSSSDAASANSQETSSKRKISGDLEDIEKKLASGDEEESVDGFDCKPQDFFSLRLGADYSLTPSFALTAAYQLPLADHLEGKTLNGSLHRVTGGIRFQFGAN